MKIYLCGGMHDKWQDKVIEGFPQHEFLDPRSHGLKDEREYTDWDLKAIREADAVLAYMNNDNPSGFGLNLEIGFARALGVPVHLAIEDLGFRSKYFGMARACSICHSSIEKAMEAINAK